METTTREKHEQIQYIEFLTQNIPRIRQFYTESFGWMFKDYGPEYCAFEGEYVDGGFTTGTPVKGSILVIIYSDSIEETRVKVLAAGGEIVKDIFEFPGGRRFHFLDPDQNELSVWGR